MGKMSEGGQKVKLPVISFITSSYKSNKFLGCIIQQGDYS